MNRKIIKNSNCILRKILNSNNNLDILKDLIESFLKIEIKEININKTPIIDNKETKKYGIVDVRIKTENEEELNVGIQIIDGDYIQNKMFLYYAKIHSNQVLYKDNRKIAKTITINILDMSYFSTINYHKVIKIKTNIMNDSILETMEMHVIELPKFNIYSDEMTNKELWTGYLNGNDVFINKAKKDNKQIKKLDKLLENYWKEEQI
jgi:predicted transposase/invertase (TIGR01784 family)